PRPGSEDLNPEQNIILREGNLIDQSFLDKKNLFEIKGSISGRHPFTTVFCRDQKTILLNPVTPFTEGETVIVTIHDGLVRADGKSVEGLTFHFKIHRKYSEDEKQQLVAAQEEVWEKEFGRQHSENNGSKEEPGSKGLPPLYITTNTNPTPGDLFFHNYNFFGIESGHHSIINNDGDSIFSRGGNDRGWDFKINHNGYITMFNKKGAYFERYDSSYNKLDIFKTQNGYLTDIHEFLIFPDGHYFLQAYEYQIKDLTIYDPTYNPHATVAGLIIQEFDTDKNLIFQWRSWDHIDIIEAPHEHFTNTVVDYVHGNSQEQDADGNLVISCRHLDQINKINLATGEFMWRLGGIKNQFTFINDPEPFNYQHDCRVLPNGHITLFDNGNYHTIPTSYAREYALDLTNMTATLVWNYKHPKVAGADVVGWALGSVQRFPNGNTLINWGYIYPDTQFPNVTEVDSNNNIVWEMRLNNKNDDVIYRAHKYDWTPCARPTGFKMKVTEITYFSAKLVWGPATGATSYNIQYRQITNSNWITQHASYLVSWKKLNQLVDD
ncbi:MAG TPA: arylsulfotransferase family protein, partial [Puia sp.]|nr:arylsulfotransferase family protein [Puia sp.]